MVFILLKFFLKFMYFSIIFIFHELSEVPWYVNLKSNFPKYTLYDLSQAICTYLVPILGKRMLVHFYIDYEKWERKYLTK